MKSTIIIVLIVVVGILDVIWLIKLIKLKALYFKMRPGRLIKNKLTGSVREIVSVKDFGNRVEYDWKFYLQGFEFSAIEHDSILKSESKNYTIYRK